MFERRLTSSLRRLAGVAVAVMLGCCGAIAKPVPLIGAHYSLETLEGRDVTEKSFAGQWQLIYFGYTFCPDVCPTELTRISNAMRKLGPLAARIRPVFITIDPARDSAKVMAAYLKSFDPRIVGLRGDGDEIAAAARQFRVYYRVRALGNGSYTVDHSSFLYILDPKGRFVQMLGGERPGRSLAQTLRKLVE
jgi:protein SCO1